MQSGRRAHGGFTYLLLLVVLAIIAITAAASLELGTTMSRRDAEQELLGIGAEYERALIAYRLATPVGQVKRNPDTLDALLLDRRLAGTKRHLRKIYVDPLTGLDRWGIARAPDGSIAAVYSLAEGQPIKQDGFADTWSRFNGATTYTRWCFGIEVVVAFAQQINAACSDASAPMR